MTAEEEIFSKKFHSANIEEKLILIENTKLPRVIKLAKRILARNFYQELEGDAKQEAAGYLRTHFSHSTIDFRGDKRLTPEQALLEIDALQMQEGLTLPDKQLLTDLRHYLQSLRGERE